MQPIERIADAWTPAGERMTLTARSGYFYVRVDRDLLMSSAEHHSEERMAELAMPAGADRVLVGGLGMGYTLRAALDRLSPGGRAVVVELMPAIVEWNRGPLAHLAGRPLDDPRTELIVRDVIDYLSASPEPFEGILLDVDNGPEAFTAASNHRLYGPKGLRRLHAALRPGGTLVVWSAFDSPTFTERLRKAGFTTTVIHARARGGKGARHTLFVATRP